MQSQLGDSTDVQRSRLRSRNQGARLLRERINVVLGINWRSMRQDHVACHLLQINCFMGVFGGNSYILGKRVKVWFGLQYNE